MTENTKIEKFQKNKGFSPYYTLEISLVCKNCGTAKGRWLAASDHATSFDFIITTCEYCGVFRFETTLYARFYDNRDEKNMEKVESKFNKEIRADSKSQKLLEGPRTIIEVKGERIDDIKPTMYKVLSDTPSRVRLPEKDKDV